MNERVRDSVSDVDEVSAEVLLPDNVSDVEYVCEPLIDSVWDGVSVSDAE